MKLKISLNEIATLLLALFIFLTFIPIFSTSFSCVVMAMVIILGFFFYRSNMIYIFLGLSCFILVLVIYYFLGKGIDFNLNGIIFYVLSIFSALFSFFIIQKLDNKQIRFLIFLIIILMLYVNISTIYISIKSPMAVRNYGYRTLNDDSFLVGMRRDGFIMYSYGVGEAMAILGPILLAFSLNIKNRLISWLGIIAVALSIFSQMMSALTTSFLLTLVFCGLTILAYLKNSKMKNNIKVIIYIIIILLITSPFLGYAMSNNFALSDRLNSLRVYLWDRTTTGDADTRVKLLIQSANEWLKNPIFGFADVGNVGIASGVSMHTAFLDYLGLYGLFSFLLFGSWMAALKYNLSNLSLSQKRCFIWGIISLIFLLIFKGPVTITTNFFFSIVICGLLISYSVEPIKKD